MLAADAVAPNLPYPPQERLPVRDIQPLARSKCRCKLRITVAFSSFACLRPPPKDFLEGSTVY